MVLKKFVVMAMCMSLVPFNWVLISNGCYQSSQNKRPLESVGLTCSEPEQGNVWPTQAGATEKK